MSQDEKFDGYDHPSLPSVDLDFSCKNNNSGTKPEAIVDVWSHDKCSWIRMPITKVETRVNKDGPADLSTTSRVDMPVTWGKTRDGEGKVPIYDYVGVSESQSDNVFDLGRVYYWNEYTERYSIEHFGYIASIGPSGENGVFRFYIYDTADLMKNIPVTKPYDQPNAQTVVNFVVNDVDYGIDNNSPIPVRSYTTTAPLEGIENTGLLESFDSGVSGWVDENVPIVKGTDIDTFNLIGDAASIAAPLIGSQMAFNAIDDNKEWLDDQLALGGKKHFTRNKHSLVDVMDWLTDEVGGAWHFQPTDTGVVLVLNNGCTQDFKIARNSYYDGQFDPDEYQYISGTNSEPVDILNNSSIEDLKPINYLELNGETADSFLGSDRIDVGPLEDVTNVDRTILGGPLGAPKGQTNKYPHIVVEYPPLLRRTNGRRLGPKPIESGKTTLAEASEQAEKEFLKAHEDNTDGSIEIRALPSIRPYDYISAVPVCNDTFDADMNPIQYEVNSVTHKVSAETDYTTMLGVSLAIDEDKINITEQFLDVESDTSASGNSEKLNEEYASTDVCEPPK